MASKLEYVDPLIRVKNVPRSAQWYSRMLGFKAAMAVPDKKNPAFIRMNTGGDNGLAFMISDGTDPVNGKKAPKATAEAIASHKAQRVVSFYFRVDKDVDTLFSSVKRKGAKVVSPVQDMPYGMREFTMRDPDGYEVAVGQNLSSGNTKPRRAKQPARSKKPSQARRKSSSTKSSRARKK